MSKKFGILLLIFILGITMFVVIFGIIEPNEGSKNVVDKKQRSFLNISANIIFWKIITFGILFSVLSFMWKRIIKVLDLRKEKITNDINNAEKNRLKSNKILIEHEKALTEARYKVSEMIENSEIESIKNKKKIIFEAKIEAQKMIENAKKEIENAKIFAINELKDQVALFSVQIATKIIQKNLDNKNHKNLVEKAFAEYKNY